MKGWEVPAPIRSAMAEPIDAGTPLSVLEALRDDVAVRATVFPDAELARQALDALIDARDPLRAATISAASTEEAKSDAPENGVVVDDREDCLGCQ